MSARKDKGTREDSMTLRSSSELADDEGRVFLAYAPPRTLMVMGRRDPRNGDLCVSRYAWKLPEVPWPGPDAPCERITGPEAERLLDAVEHWIASQQNSRRERAKMTQQSRRQLLMKAVRDAAIELARRGEQYLPAAMPDEPVIMASRIESAAEGPYLDNKRPTPDKIRAFTGDYIDPDVTDPDELWVTVCAAARR
jgi:hypothetical protein